MTSRASGTAAVPPWSLAVPAMLSVQLGSALSVHLISTVGPAGTSWLRLSIGALVFLALARPPLRAIRPHDVPPTRQRMLVAGHEEVYLHGFHGASLGAILRRAGVTKGAFFHHFASKNAFGYAIVDEILAQMIAAQWVTPLEASSDPLTTISTEFERGIEVLMAQQPILGCPLNNLAQEMNPLDAGFRARTTHVFQTWREAYRSALTRAQQRQIVLAAVDPGDVAHLLVAQIEGTLSLARNTQDPQTLMTGARALRSYLASLRAPGQ